MKSLVLYFVVCLLPAIVLCQAPRPCITCAMECSYGFEMGSDGCPKCQCKQAPNPAHPCIGHFCGDQVCEEKQVQCITSPCYPVPECKPFSCPQVGYGYGGCMEACRVDKDCDDISYEDMRCCSNGCGHVCTTRHGTSVVDSSSSVMWSFLLMVISFVSYKLCI